MKTQIKIRGKDITFETGKMAKQADGAVTVRYGDTVVLVTVVSANEIKEDVDFFPLTAEYREKTSAAGRFPGGYIKRENRPSEKEILSARIIDRPIRPLFPDGYVYETQIIADVLSADGENDPDILAVNGASAALAISDIPFLGPIGAVRVGLVNGDFIINPTHAELKETKMDMVIAGTKTGISMIEGDTAGVTEETMVKAIEFAYKHILEIIAVQEEFQKNCGKNKKDKPLVKVNEKLADAMRASVGEELSTVVRIKEKTKRQEALSNLLQKAIIELQPIFLEVNVSTFGMAFHKIEKETVRNLILNEGKRCDGRGIRDIRPITSEIGILPRTHGSALFTRGETQSLAITTLGTAADEQKGENLSGEFSKTFMLHYNFPPFSVGEVRAVRGPGRREIGHGALAESALKAILPEKDKFPYTIRIVSDILESNGSSSMASVCGGCLSLMDAGVPIKDMVAGVAMGLVKGDKKTVILTDIIGTEDACGDMDFKVAGTKTGITAFQLDVKLKEGIAIDTLKEGLSEAHTGRLFILSKMAETINKPKETISTFAPKIQTIQINPDKIGAVIGSGGKVIKRITEITGANIEINDDGKVMVSSTNSESIEKAIKIIKGLTEDIEVGTIYEGPVKSMLDFGAFVEILPEKTGLVHISELANHFVKKVEDVVKIGQVVRVIVTEIDEKGRINLSMKRLEKE
jgi:polyribonucleotide nucleotidyltransferase